MENDNREHGLAYQNAPPLPDANVGTRYPLSGNILFVNNLAALDSNEEVLQELENLFPDFISRTVSTFTHKRQLCS
jgi:hypothetical protein